MVEKTTHDTFSIAWSARRSSSYPLESVSDYNFTVLFSEDPVNDFTVVNNTIIDGSTGPFIIIQSLKHLNHNRDRYYKVRATLKASPYSYQDSEVIYNGNNADGVISSIQFAETMLNNYYIGEPMYLLKRKVDGDRCPECWNSITFRRTKTHCPTCRGTGFYDGFYRPMEIQIAIDRNPKVSEQSQTGEIQVTNIKGRMGYFPLVVPRDMIVSKDMNERFTIVNVDYTKFPNLSCGRGDYSNDAAVVSQILNLAELNPDDDKFNVVIIGRDLRATGAISNTSPVFNNVATRPTHTGYGGLMSKLAGVTNA